MMLPYDRGRNSLRAALARKAGDEPIFAKAAAQLNALEQAARREPPFSFYARLLGQGGARRRFLARLGLEANDAIDEFLNVALEYERRETPSLQGFLTWLRDARAEVKRDMEIARDEVRVMTVHGAKGLEAPIVILADTITPPVIKPPRLLQLADGAIIWAGRKADDVDQVAAARVRANSETEDEYRRLLYVAMTRAAERLIICGAEGLNRPPRNCWYNLVYEPLQPFLVAEDECGEKVLRYRKPMPGQVTEAEPPPAEAANADRHDIPPWLFQPAAVEAPRLVSLSPSSAFAEDIGRVAAPATASAAERRNALARGRIVHRLMQSLPDIPAAGRQDAIERYLKGAAADFLPAERAEIARQVLTILNDLVFADVFAPGSRAEVPIVGRITRPDGVVIAVSGQVDRLAVIGETVLIADYKTDRVAPRRLAEVPDAYVAQLALYRAVLARIYPEKTIRAALIFTEGPNVMEVPGAAMVAALAAVMSLAV